MFLYGFRQGFADALASGDERWSLRSFDRARSTPGAWDLHFRPVRTDTDADRIDLRVLDAQASGRLGEGLLLLSAEVVTTFRSGFGTSAYTVLVAQRAALAPAGKDGLPDTGRPVSVIGSFSGDEPRERSAKAKGVLALVDWSDPGWAEGAMDGAAGAPRRWFLMHAEDGGEDGPYSISFVQADGTLRRLGSWPTITFDIAHGEPYVGYAVRVLGLGKGADGSARSVEGAEIRALADEIGADMARRGDPLFSKGSRGPVSAVRQNSAYVRVGIR